jgi:murein DD-endopeptidase MepM/ murein hydrolase activator NlpD
MTMEPTKPSAGPPDKRERQATDSQGNGRRIGRISLGPRWSLFLVAVGVVVVGGGAYLALGGHGPLGAVTGSAPATQPARHPGRHPVTRPATAPTAAPLAMPVAGNVEAGFGWVYSSYLGEWYFNPGVTLSVAAGTPVHAAWGGRVSFVGQMPYMGLTVKVNDGNGYTTVYGHLASAAVTAGETVSQGATLGTVAGPSIYSRQPGAHLDFQVYHQNVAVNPESFVKGSM